MKKQLKELLEERVDWYGDSPRMEVYPTRLDFGSVPICKPATAFITVRNLADAGMPADFPQLWLQFETHPWTNPAAPDPWAEFVSVAGTVPAETPPPPRALPPDLTVGLVFFPGPFTPSLPTDTVPAGQTITIPVLFTPQVGHNLGTLTIESNDPNQQAVQIQLVGQGVDAPATIRLFPPTVSFGLLPLGATRIRGITIGNSGCAPFVVTAISSSGAYEFTVSPPALPASIAAGAQIVVAVEFQPDSNGRFTGSVAISTNIQANPFIVPLVGSGRGRIGNFVPAAAVPAIVGTRQKAASPAAAPPTQDASAPPAIPAYSPGPANISAPKAASRKAKRSGVRVS
jgi:hypothetical protein